VSLGTIHKSINANRRKEKYLSVKRKAEVPIIKRSYIKKKKRGFGPECPYINERSK
jgi:hypothetical protein